MKKYLTTSLVLYLGTAAIFVNGQALIVRNPEIENPTLHGDFYLDSDVDSDIDPGAEDWTNGYFASMTIDKPPTYSNYCDWLKQISRLYKWRLLKRKKAAGYYFAIFAIGMDDSQLAFCFHHISGKSRPLKIEVKDINGKNLRLANWGPNNSVVQEYRYYDRKTGEITGFRELNGYIIRMRRFPRHLRVIAYETNGEDKMIFNEIVRNVVDSVRNIENIGVAKMPDTSTLDRWVKIVGLPGWEVLKKVSNQNGFFAVFKVNENSFAFCRQLKNNPGIYKRKSVLKITDAKGKPLNLNLISVLPLNRRYRVSQLVNKIPQMTKYSIIDGATYVTERNLPTVFRLCYMMKGDNGKRETYFDEVMDLSK